MASFEILEKKVVQLIELTKTLKSENSALTKENAGLKKKVQLLESDAHKNNETVALEKEKAKNFMVDIIKNIDHLVGSNG